MKSLTFSCLICILKLYVAQKVALKAKSCSICKPRSQCRLFLFFGNNREEPRKEAASTR